MAVAGSIVLELLAKTGAFETDMGRAERRMKSMEREARRVGAALGTVLAAGAGAVAAGLALYVRNTIEAEKVQAQLAARIKDTGSAAQRTLEQLNMQAEKLQGLTIFDDEAIGGAQAMLLTFKQIKDVQFDRAVEAALDLSTAMGTDLNAAALQVGKALNDPVKGLTALSRAGVQFTEDQKSLIKSLVESGNVAAAQRVILEELEGQMGTAAEAARNTLGGALTALGNSFNNLLEGDAGSGGMLATREAVEGLNTALNDPEIKQGIDTIASGIGSLVAEMVEAIPSIARFSSELYGAIARVSDYLDARHDELAATLQGDTAAAAEAAQRTKNIVAGTDFRNVRGGSDTESGIPTLDTVTVLAPRPGGTNGKGRSARAGKGSELPDFAKTAADDLRELIEQEDRARQAFDAMAATLGGPLAEAEFLHQENLREITELGRAAARSSEEIAGLKALEVKRYEEEASAIRDRLDPGRQLLEDLEFERSLLGMSNAERATAIQLRGLEVEQIEKYGTAVLIANQMREEELRGLDQQIEAMDAVRDAGRGLVSDLANGVKPIDAITDAFDRLYAKITDMIAENLMDQLFGQKGTSGSGSAGGWLSSLFGSLFNTGASSTSISSAGGWGAFTPNTGGFETGGSWWSSFGGAFANGGYTPGDKPILVGENEPEMMVERTGPAPSFPMPPKAVACPA